MKSKNNVSGVLIINSEPYTSNCWVAGEKRKKKVPVELITNLEIYTRYCWIADEEQKRWKKSLQKNVILLEGGNSLSNIFNGNNLKKKFGKPYFREIKKAMATPTTLLKKYHWKQLRLFFCSS